jgi:hypothetical protein
MQNERRQSLRISVLKRAKIIYGNADLTHTVIDCVVIDVSSTGARVRTMSPVTIPEWVTLVFPEGATYRARQLWARGSEIGFAFAAVDDVVLLDAMISGLTPDQRRALIARIEASLIAEPE